MSRFGWSPGELTVSQCARCARKHEGSATCDAFREGIPLAILRNEADHREPFPGDGGMRFKARTDEG